MKVVFKEVSLFASKTGVCSVCGKKVKRTRKFFQTLNPFNKNSQGDVKTAKEIMAANSVETAKWEKEPITHLKCENWWAGNK